MKPTFSPRVPTIRAGSQWAHGSLQVQWSAALASEGGDVWETPTWELLGTYMTWTEPHGTSKIGTGRSFSHGYGQVGVPVWDERHLKLKAMTLTGELNFQHSRIYCYILVPKISKNDQNHSFQIPPGESCRPWQVDVDESGALNLVELFGAPDLNT